MKHPSVEQIINENQWGPTFNRPLFLHELAKALFTETITEEHQENPERTKVLNLIALDKWDHSPSRFAQSIKGSKHSKMLTPYAPEELEKMECFTVPGYNIGFALKDLNDIVAVHNNSSVRGIGKPLIAAAIRHGGTTLDHFDGFLTPLYSGLGFDEYKRKPYDSTYDKDGEFAKKYGKQPVIYRRLKKDTNAQPRPEQPHP